MPETKQKQCPAVDVTCDESKVWYCEEQYCIGTWNVRSMNQGKLEVVSQTGGEGNGNPLQYSCLENPMDRGDWWAESMGLLRVRYDWATSLSCIGEGNGNPLQCSCLENFRDGVAWWAAIYGVTQSPTRLKQCSNSSSSQTGDGKRKYQHIRNQWTKMYWNGWI